jgi:hypothetical protein
MTVEQPEVEPPVAPGHQSGPAQPTTADDGALETVSAQRRAAMAEARAADAEAERDLVADRLLEAQQADLALAQVRRQLTESNRRIASLERERGSLTWSLTAPLHRYEVVLRRELVVAVQFMVVRLVRLSVNVILHQLVERVAEAALDRSGVPRGRRKRRA